MNTSQARALGNQICDLVAVGNAAAVYILLEPVLKQRVKFDLLRAAAEPVSACPFEKSDKLMELVAGGRSIGGWVIIASLQEGQLAQDLPGAFSRCREYIILSDVWYATDSLAEGVTGKALVGNFHPSLELLYPWREDKNRWVRRAVGVSVHHWAKRSRGAAEHFSEARQLLSMLAPLFGESNINAVKGIGWGLKTLGRYYPDLLATWLDEQVELGNKPSRAVMLRKAQTYLNYPERKAGQNSQ